MTQRVALFWPGDHRDYPNQQALPRIQAATAQLESSLRKLRREPYRIEGYLTRPHEAIEKLGPVDDPLIGVCVHWFYGRHATDEVVDVGQGEVVKLPPEKRDAWWEGTTRQWPFMAADLGIKRDTLMARCLSNHVAVAYGDVFEEMVALSKDLGCKVRVLGGTRPA